LSWSLISLISASQVVIIDVSYWHLVIVHFKTMFYSILKVLCVIERASRIIKHSC
jgi:hypothetical protein